MPTNRPVLPPLLFGETGAQQHVNARSLGDQIQRVFPGLNAYDPLGNPEYFCAKSSLVCLRNITVVSSAISPTYVDRSGPQDMTLIFPLVGQCQVTLDGKRFDWGAGRAGVFMPEFDGRTVGRGDTRSLLMFHLKQSALEYTARSMLGLGTEEDPRLRLDEPRLTPMTLAGYNVELVLRTVASLIELYRGDPDLLTQLGFEDIIYRHIVGMLRSDIILPSQTAPLSKQEIKTRTTGGVCDAMLSNLGKRWTLTEMEQVSGLSARVLQYAFKARFGCSPTDWLREQRLQLARRRLLLNDFTTITQLAYDCGFSGASQFSGLYKVRFGITPSRT